jgi:hypothetical protein
MREHRWFGLGTAQMTEGQATEWSNLDGATLTPLTMNVSEVACLICDASYLDAGEDCPGPPPDQAAPRHRWLSLMTMPMTVEEARDWADPEAGANASLLPRSTNLVCVLCGQPYEQAGETCPERRFWLAGGDEPLERPELDASASVRLKRGMCFGKCPAYEVVLRADGTASWQGEGFVDRMGHHDGRFDPSQLVRLLALIERYGFFSWADEYTRFVTDLPTYELTVTRGGQAKRVIQYATDAPPHFWTIAALIDGVASHVLWDDSRLEGPDPF